MGHISQLLSLAISFKIIEILLSQKNWFRNLEIHVLLIFN